MTNSPSAMLWFDNDPRRSVADRAADGARHFEKKYGAAPNFCMVHPSMLPAFPDGQPALPGDQPAELAGMHVKINRAVMPNHFWIAIADLTGGQP